MTDEEFFNKAENLNFEDFARFAAKHKSIWDLSKEEQEKRMWDYAVHEYAERIEQKKLENLAKWGVYYDPFHDYPW